MSLMNEGGQRKTTSYKRLSHSVFGKPNSVTWNPSSCTKRTKQISLCGILYPFVLVGMSLVVFLSSSIRRLTIKNTIYLPFILCTTRVYQNKTICIYTVYISFLVNLARAIWFALTALTLSELKECWRERVAPQKYEIGSFAIRALFISLFAWTISHSSSSAL